jgi:type I restriction-modification system DNA methylase subunit
MSHGVLPTQPHEEVVNVCLAKLLGRYLGETNVVVPEKTIPAGRKRFDVKVEYKGIEFVIEASYDRSDALNDAKKRVEEGLIDTVAVALYYDYSKFLSINTPDQIENTLNNLELELKVFSLGLDISQSLLKYVSGKKQLAEERTKYWVSMKLQQFPQLFDSIIEFLVSEDTLLALTEEIGQKTNDFVAHLIDATDRIPKLAETISANLYLALFSSSGKNEDAILPEVPKEVVFAHTYISVMMAAILYDSVAPRHGLDSMYRVLSKKKGHPLLTMKETFSNILEIDYAPVFDIALTITDYLFDVQTNPTVMQDLRELIETVQHIVLNKALLRRDFIGHIYHKVTGNIATMKGYATFYTKAPIANFLAYTEMYGDSEMPKWFDMASKDSFRICDFACGSGTLLSASYSTILNLYRKECFEKKEQPDYESLHKTLLEQKIWGFDALEQAAQTASVVLSLHELGVPLEKMNMYHVPVDKTGSLGSLNFWWANRQLVPISRRGIEQIIKEEVIVPHFNFIIMNPPFSRATAPGVDGSRPRIFDFVSSQEAFEKLWSSYTRLIRDMEKTCYLNKNVSKLIKEYVGKNRIFQKRNIDPLYAGAALPFFFLADRYLEPEGKIALVLPRTVLESSSFFLVRAALVSRYEIECIVTSSERANPNFSYSAQLSEALIIAKKMNNKKASNAKTFIVNFKKQPRDVLSGMLAAKDTLNQFGQTEQQRTIGSRNIEIKAVNKTIVDEFVWNFAPILNLPPLVKQKLEQLIAGQLFDIKLQFLRVMDLDGFAMTNPRTFRGRQFSSKFRVSDEGEFRFLNQTGKKMVNKLALDMLNTIPIVPLHAESSILYEKSGGRLLVPEAIRFNTTPLLATWSQRTIVSSRAHMLKCDTEKERALCAWMNSVFSIIWLRILFTTLEERFGHIYGWHIRTLKVPDLSKQAIVTGLANVFHKYAHATWQSLPEQFKQVIDGKNSMRLDFDYDIISSLSKASNVSMDESSVKNELKALYAETLSML